MPDPFRIATALIFTGMFAASTAATAGEDMSCQQARVACEEACDLKAEQDEGFSAGCRARCEAGAKVCEVGRAVEELRPEVEKQLDWWRGFLDGLTGEPQQPSPSPAAPAPNRPDGTDL